MYAQPLPTERLQIPPRGGVNYQWAMSPPRFGKAPGSAPCPNIVHVAVRARMFSALSHHTNAEPPTRTPWNAGTVTAHVTHVVHSQLIEVSHVIGRGDDAYRR
jgi:hypothetical protein